MTEYLISLGHRRLGFIVGHPEHYASGRRLEGFKAALKRHGIELREEYVKQGYFTFDSGLEKAAELLAMKEPPTAIFASNDDMAARCAAGRASARHSHSCRSVCRRVSTTRRWRASCGRGSRRFFSLPTILPTPRLTCCCSC